MGDPFKATQQVLAELGWHPLVVSEPHCPHREIAELMEAGRALLFSLSEPKSEANL